MKLTDRLKEGISISPDYDKYYDMENRDEFEEKYAKQIKWLEANMGKLADDIHAYNGEIHVLVKPNKMKNKQLHVNNLSSIGSLSSLSVAPDGRLALVIEV